MRQYLTNPTHLVQRHESSVDDKWLTFTLNYGSSSLASRFMPPSSSPVGTDNQVPSCCVNFMALRKCGQSALLSGTLLLWNHFAQALLSFDLVSFSFLNITSIRVCVSTRLGTRPVSIPWTLLCVLSNVCGPTRINDSTTCHGCTYRFLQTFYEMSY